MDKYCPGASDRTPSPENVKCHNCGNEVEIWTDELQAKCPNCGTMFVRDQPPVAGQAVARTEIRNQSE
ncbi:MAG: hypothetical protein Q7O66_13420 [Dehalococcoidia bacterium]|nr:hypothetical protein [Dehalococcoidia bacterium]